MISGLYLRVMLAVLLQDLPVVERGRLSVYWPNDSMRTGNVLACDRPTRRRFYRRGSVHVAHRRWRRIGCGTKVRVCADATGRCITAPVLDSGPWGIYRGKLEGAVKEGRWRVWTRYKPPSGWRFRGVVDLSREAWRRLGKPPGLSKVTLMYRPKRRGRR